MNRYARLMKPQVDSPISLQPLTIDAMNMMQTKFPIAETMIETTNAKRLGTLTMMI